MQNEPNPFLCYLVVLGSRKFAACFSSHFFSQHGIVKYVNNIVSNSVSRQDDIVLEYKDMMT